MFYKSGYEWYMNKPLCRNLQNIDRNDTGEFGVCKCYWSGDFWLREWEKNHEKITFKGMDCKTPYIFQDTAGEEGKKKKY